MEPVLLAVVVTLASEGRLSSGEYKCSGESWRPSDELAPVRDPKPCSPAEYCEKSDMVSADSSRRLAG